MVSVANSSTLYYNPSGAGGDLKLKVEVFNWAQHLGEKSSVVTDIDKIVVESPQGILPQPYVEFSSASLAPTAAPGTTDASSIVSIEIDGCSPKAVSGQQVMIAVYQAGLGYDNGGAGTKYPSAPLSAYFLSNVQVSNVNQSTRTCCDIHRSRSRNSRYPHIRCCRDGR